MDRRYKSYCQSVVNTIRKYDSDAIIICGTGTWSQDIDQVLGNKLSDKNCVYALHFYANTHTDWLRNRLQNCYKRDFLFLYLSSELATQAETADITQQKAQNGSSFSTH